MPLLPGKKNVGRNIEELQSHGYPHQQAIAIALDIARKHRAEGGPLATQSTSQATPPSPPEFPSPLAQKAWDLGLVHNQRLQGESRGLDFYEGLPEHEGNLVANLEEHYPTARAFYESAVRGAKKPQYMTGWRYDEAPKEGFSRNHVNGSQELGVSMASVEGNPYQWYPMSNRGKAIRYRGYVLDHDILSGSDGEPLMVGLRKHEDQTIRKQKAYGGSTITTQVPGGFFHGPIHSHVAGRTDHLPITVESGSYVLPADIISAGGEGSTIAGFRVLRRMFGGEPYGQKSAPYGQLGGPYGEALPRATGGKVKAAGILFLSPQKEILLMRRTGKDHAGEWALPAGRLEKSETPEQAARRETVEEAGYAHEGSLSPFMHSSEDGIDFTTFLAHSNKFKPKLNEEHDGALWVKPAEAEKLPLHPGVRKALDKLRVGKAHGGAASGVPIVAAGGEWVIPPHHVERIGAGDLDQGHRVLDAFVKHVRKELIKELQKLPGPRHD